MIKMSETEKSRASYCDIYDELRPNGFYGSPCTSCTSFPHDADIFAVTKDRLSDPEIAASFAFFSSNREKLICVQKNVVCMPLKKDRLPGELRIAIDKAVR
jgi:hypothetical protein